MSERIQVSSFLGSGVALLLVLVPPSFARADLCPGPGLVWSHTYDGGIGADDRATDVSIDPSGNVIFAGSMNVIGEGRNWFIRKLNSDGIATWTRVYSGVASGDDEVLAIDTDASGNIYVAGYETHDLKLLGTNRNWMVRKYAPGGGLLFSTDFVLESVVSAVDEARAIAVSTSGSIYVGGYYDDNGGKGKDWHVRRYANNGVFAQAWTYDSPASDDDVINGLAIDDNSGDFVLVGYDTRADLSQGRDWLIRKRSGMTGSLMWARVHNGSADGDDEAHDVAVDPSSRNVYVAGSESVSGEGLNWMVRAFDKDGAVLWTVTANSPGNADDEALSVAVDSGGDVLVAGYENRWELGESDNWVLRKYRSDGSLLWQHSFNGMNDGPDRLLGVATDASSTVVVAGYEDRGDIGEGLNLHVRQFRNAACLAPTITFVPPDPLEGEWVDVCLTVTNVGSGGASAVAPSIDVNSGAPLVAALSAPSSLALLPPGGTTTFAWTFSVSGGGIVAFTATATGTDAGLGSTVKASASSLLATRGKAFLELTKTASGSVIREGDTLTYSITVVNTGESTAENVTVWDTLSAGMVYLSCNAPGGGVCVHDGAKVDWTLLDLPPSSSGELSFSVLVVASGAMLGPNVSEVRYQDMASALYRRDRSNTVYVAAVTGLDSHLSVSASPVAVGQWVDLTFTVTNTGSGGVLSMMPDWQFNSGAPLLMYISGPTPTGPLTLLPLSSTVFVWTYSVSGNGNVCLTVTASGTDAGLGMPVQTADSCCLTAPGNATLAVAARIEPTSPVEDQDFTVIVTASNTGQVGAENVMPALVIQSGAPLLTYLSGPTPALPVALGVAASQVFTWRYRASGDGVVSFTVSVSGDESGTGQPVSAATSFSVTIEPAADGPTKGIEPGQSRVIGGGPNKVGVDPKQGVKIQVWSDAAGTVTATFKIYDQSLALVREWTADVVAGRPDLVIWDGRDDRGRMVPPGVYYLMVTGEGIAKMKLGDVVIPVGR